MNESKLYRRVQRRSLHRSRSLAVIVALSIVVLVLVFVAIESVLEALGQGPMVVSPTDATAFLDTNPQVAPSIAAGAAVLGIILIVIALAPARLGRHIIPNERLAIVVDDSALAGALLREARTESRVSDNRIRASVTRRSARVSVTPTSGVPVNAGRTKSVVDAVLDDLSPKPGVRANVTIEKSGAVGS